MRQKLAGILLIVFSIATFKHSATVFSWLEGSEKLSIWGAALAVSADLLTAYGVIFSKRRAVAVFGASTTLLTQTAYALTHTFTPPVSASITIAPGLARVLLGAVPWTLPVLQVGALVLLSQEGHGAQPASRPQVIEADLRPRPVTKTEAVRRLLERGVTDVKALQAETGASRSLIRKVMKEVER